MLIRRHNSYAPRSKRRTGRREVQSRESVKEVIKLSVVNLWTLLVARIKYSSDEW
jgi:hypothetical protein